MPPEFAVSPLSVIHAANRDPRWLAFLARQRPTLFQSPDWAGLIQEVYGFPARVALAFEGDQLVGGLPYSEIDDFRGRRRVVGAFADVCEPLGDERAWLAIERALVSDGIPWQIRSRTVPSAGSQPASTTCVHQRIELPRTLEEAEQNCDRKQRTKVRYAVRAGVTTRRIDDAAALDVFYLLHSRTRKEKHRLLPQPRRFFEAIARRFFPERGFVLVAELEGKVLATELMIACGDTLYFKFIASDIDALAYKPNDLLMWKAIESAIEMGFRRIDLGISEADSLIQFKRKFGAVDEPVYVGRYNSGEKTAATAALERALAGVTEALTQPEVPLSAVQAGGDALYQFFV